MKGVLPGENSTKHHCFWVEHALWLGGFDLLDTLQVRRKEHSCFSFSEIPHAQFAQPATSTSQPSREPWVSSNAEQPCTKVQFMVNTIAVLELKKTKNSKL